MSGRHQSVWSGLLFLLLSLQAIGAGQGAGQPDPETGLYRYDGCTYLDADWNDGDSFRMQLPGGESVTARLYEVDSIETSIHDTTAARRLRAQRRYFGISDYGETPRDSIEKAIELGEAATVFTRETLQQPFTVFTSHADARGGGNRIYVFVKTADGAWLADLLVERGLARAYGVYRQTPDGISQSESIERMQDIELTAVANRRGVWAYTDWRSLPEERLAQRQELAELRIALRSGPKITAEDPVDLNEADAERLEQLPGIGPALAARIIASRPFRDTTELTQVTGIGDKTYATLAPLVTVAEAGAAPSK